MDADGLSLDDKRQPVAENDILILPDLFTAADKDILKGNIGMSQGSLVLQSWLK